MLNYRLMPGSGDGLAAGCTVSCTLIYTLPLLLLSHLAALLKSTSNIRHRWIKGFKRDCMNMWRFPWQFVFCKAVTVFLLDTLLCGWDSRTFSVTFTVPRVFFSSPRRHFTLIFYSPMPLFFPFFSLHDEMTWKCSLMCLWVGSLRGDVITLVSKITKMHPSR